MRTPTPMLREPFLFGFEILLTWLSGIVKLGSSLKKPSLLLTPQQLASSTKPLPSATPTKHRPPCTSLKAAASPSPQKPSLLLRSITGESEALDGSALSTFPIPPFFSGLATGSRILRQRLGWISNTALELAEDPTRSGGRSQQQMGKELARVVGGRSEEWWRSNSATYRDEISLGLEGRPSFVKFCAGADGKDPAIPFYQAFVEHAKLCENDDADCRFHRALVIFFAHRAKPGDTRAKLPKRYDLSEKDVRCEWKGFARFYEELEETQEWAVDVEAAVLDRGGVRRPMVSATKRKGGESLERGLRKTKSRRSSP